MASSISSKRHSVSGEAPPTRKAHPLLNWVRFRAGFTHPGRKTRMTTVEMPLAVTAPLHRPPAETAAVAWQETLFALSLGMGHDINNLLAGIVSLAEASRLQLAPEDPQHENLTLIRTRAMHAGELFRRLLQLQRPPSGKPALADLTKLVGGALELFRKTLPRGVTLGTALTPEALPVRVDAADFRRTLLSLLFHLSRAAGAAGRLHVETRGGDNVIMDVALDRARFALPEFVREFAGRHGGEAGLFPGARGLSVRISLPCADPDTDAA
jgi:signal transduction histidine kinase